MSTHWAEHASASMRGGSSPTMVDALVKTRLRPGQRQVEPEAARRTYLALDVRLESGEYRGLSYFDIDGAVVLDPSHTKLTIPFRTCAVVIHGIRLLALYREILHHSVDILEAVPHATFNTGDGWAIERITLVES